jgi:hypothetical protein
MPLAHVQSFISQNSCSRQDSREPLSGSLSLDRQAPESVSSQAPPGALRRTHRLVSGNRPLAAALRRALWTTVDRRAALHQAPKSYQGSGETASGFPIEPYTSLVSRVGAPKSSSARRRRGLEQSSVEPDAHRQCTVRLRRATGAPASRAKVSGPLRSPSAGHLHAPKSAEAKVVGSRQGSHMDLMRKRDASSSSEEPDKFSFKHGKDHEEPTRQPMTPFQAPKSSRDCRRSAFGLEDPLTTNKKNRGSRTTLYSPLRHAMTPRGHLAPFQRSLRSRRTVWGKRWQTVGVRSKPLAYQQLAPALRRAPESVAGSQTARLRSPKAPSVCCQTTSGSD